MEYFANPACALFDFPYRKECGQVKKILLCARCNILLSPLVLYSTSHIGKNADNLNKILLCVRCNILLSLLVLYSTSHIGKNADNLKKYYYTLDVIFC